MKEPGQTLYEATGGPFKWSRLPDHARLFYNGLESAIRADERAKVIDECAKAVDRDLGEMDSEMRSYAKYFASNVRALRAKGAAQEQKP
jgi:hypothetical protein